MKNLVLFYGDPIAIMSQKSEKYLQYDKRLDQFNANGNHPFLRVNLEENMKYEEFVLIKQ